MIRTILSIASAVLLIAGSGVLVGFSAEREANARFTGLAVDVQEIDGMFFVDAAGVTDQILANDSIEGTFVADLSLQEVERWVREIPAVDEVLVYPGLDRTLQVHVTQRKPLARVHTASDAADVYIDSDGLELPLSPYYTARVPVIHASSVEAALEAFALVEATHQDPLWSAFIDQIEVNPDGSLDVVPRIGSARIHVGSMERLDEKLNKLLVFYTEQIERGNLNIYKRIDLTYQDQVVAQRYY
jgi:cell division protein FtsQ